jgi:hypothetical protein
LPVHHANDGVGGEVLYVREAGARLGHGPKLDHDAGVGRAAEHRRSIDVEEGV